MEVSINATLPPTGNSRLNLKASPNLFTHAKSVQLVNYDINTRDLTSRHACLEDDLAQEIGNLSEGSVPVIFIPMTTVQKLFFIGQFEYNISAYHAHSGLQE